MKSYVPFSPAPMVNRPQSEVEAEVLRRCIAKGQPFGSESFKDWTMELLQLESAFRDRGQPAKEARRG